MPWWFVHREKQWLVFAVQGETVGMAQILDLRHILTESTTDLRQPIALERQLLESSHSTDDEVGLSMLQLLKVRWKALCF